jgi:pilus assembly protein Flp/PilA
MTGLFVALQIHMHGLGDRLRREDGATAVEYGLLVTLIGLAMAVGATLLGTNLKGLFNMVAGKLPQT